MRRLIRFFVDWAAIWTAGYAASQFGLLWGVVAMVGTLLYGCWCFYDGGRTAYA